MYEHARTFLFVHTYRSTHLGMNIQEHSYSCTHRGLHIHPYKPQRQTPAEDHPQCSVPMNDSNAAVKQLDGRLCAVIQSCLEDFSVEFGGDDRGYEELNIFLTK